MADHEYFEPEHELSEETRDLHRALISLTITLRAVDRYTQQIDLCKDESLKALLIHNREEKLEHTAMLIEWLRRRDATFNDELRAFLYKDGPIIDPRH